MALTNSQYDQIMRIYEQRQIEDEHRLREHYRKAYALIPALEQVDQSISSLGIEKAKRLLTQRSTVNGCWRATKAPCLLSGKNWAG